VRRQIGSDRRSFPTSPIAKEITDRRIAMGRLAIVATIVGWLGYVVVWILTVLVQGQGASPRQRLEAVIYLAIVSLLTFSSLAYLASRLGYFYRGKGHIRTPRAVLDDFFDECQPPLTVIIPSYREDARVIRTTLLTAALQEYPDIDIVLLIDDPIDPSDPKHRVMLERARNLPHDVERLLAYPRELFETALDEFKLRQRDSNEVGPYELNILADSFDKGVAWLNLQMAEMSVVDHTDIFLANQILNALAIDFSLSSRAIRSAASSGASFASSRVEQLYRRLINVFSARLNSFERKAYASLSHEPNKAMNLNSYISLMGGSYNRVETLHGLVLERTETPDESSITIRNPDYVLTLDADSMLLPEYCLRLVYLMEQSQYSRVGVAQTPYSSYPASTTRLERIAGATTDLQYLVHQGLTHYNATFWVGANAVIRKTALDDIAEVAYVENNEIKRYIQDRTAIEDTESTLDLVTHGWTLVNYPERLSYSATPPDFGSLCIQRRRWADGGLIIVPKIRRLTRTRKSRGEQTRLGEKLLRFNYMASITWSSLSLLVLLFYPFANKLVSPLLGLLALPYFVAMASDLKYCGYKRMDVLRIYGFNLILIPVNLAGTMNSLIQIITGTKGVFGRTPKVRKRTVAPMLFVLTPYAIVLLSLFTLVRDYQLKYWYNAAYAVLNISLALYAIFAYIGPINSISDIAVQVKPWFQKKQPRKSRRRSDHRGPTPQPTDWFSVLHYGNVELEGGRVLADNRRAISEESRAVLLEEAPRIAAQLRIDGPLQDAEADTFSTYFQPVFELATMKVVGYEALSRFDDGSSVTDHLGDLNGKTSIELERNMLLAALDAAKDLPKDLWLSLNTSADLLHREGTLLSELGNHHESVIFEVKSSHLDHENSSHHGGELPPIPEGMSLAIDDGSPDPEGLGKLTTFNPAFVKIDRPWVRGIDRNAVNQTLVGGMVRLAEERGVDLIAEGIETEEELAVLLRLGVKYGQGYLLGRPAPFHEPN
jgi:EAL domain-containing protein (putative c-di-GMP-specific phosphodiesterase class I)/cellulose synthase/poly-beta-1,6-N-acetylglucosamine synthase-like glycosyltransferase